MTTTISLITIAAEILNRLPTVGKLLTADSVGTTYIDCDAEFGNSRLGVDELADLWFWRYNLTGADYKKRTGNVTTSSGQLAHTSVDNYVDTTDTAFGLLGIDPDILVRAIIRGWARRSSRSTRALTVGADMDMETSGVSNWAGTNATPTKVTTAADVFSGTQSLKVAASGAGGYARGATIRVHPGTKIYTAIRCRADVGTITHNIYDVTNAAVISGTAPSYSGEDWAVLWREDTVPDGCEEIKLQPTITGASDVVLVDTYFGPYTYGRRRYVLPTWMDETWRTRLVRPAEYTALPTVTQGYDAYSRNWSGDLVPPRPGDSGDYSIENNRSDANPFALQLNMELPMCPVELAVERLLADTETFTGPSSTTILPKDELVNFAMEEFLEVLVSQFGERDMAPMLQEYRGYTAIDVIARRPPPRVEQGSRQAVWLNA